MIISIICMIHYLTSAVIYKISCSRRVAANFSCCFHFNYLECWKILSPQSKSPFWTAPCRRTETPTKDRKTNLSSSISVFSFRVWTTIFWLAILEIITTQNINFWCVRRETKKKKKKKKKKKTREALHKCSMLRIALKKKENSRSATSMLMLRTALKRKLAKRYINALCFASH